MAFPSHPSLLGLLLLLALPPEGAAAMALLTTQGATASPPGLEQRLQRIQAAVQDQQAEAGEEPPPSPDQKLAYVFVNGPAVGFRNGGFRNGGFYNGGFRNGGFSNGGFRNGGAWRNGGGGAWRNGGFRNSW
jgi:rSAM-associated Gly-rich repeat protein